MTDLPIRRPGRGRGSSRSSTDLPPDDALTIVYRRVSTERQGDEDRASMPEQLRCCTEYAERLGRPVDGVWDDLGVSGRKTERLERLAQWCEGHRRTGEKRGLVVVLRRDRLGRFVHDPNTGPYFEYRMRRAGWDVDFVLEPRTGNTMADATMAAIHREAGAEESRERARRASKGMNGQAKQGNWQGRAPFGYVREAVQESNGKARSLVPRERSADGERVRLKRGAAQDIRTVQRMFKWAVDGMPIDHIANKLNAGHVRGPWAQYSASNWRSGRRPEWTAHNVKSILKNPVYVGDVVFGRRRNVGEEKEKRIKAPPSEWIVVRDAHPALISRETFDRVQIMFEQRKGQRARKVSYLLTGGMLRCVCGAQFTAGGGTRPSAPDPLRFTFYRCLDCRKPRVTINRPWIEGER